MASLWFDTVATGRYVDGGREGRLDLIDSYPHGCWVY